MVTTGSTSKSLKEYLKKYENSAEEEKKKKKKKKSKPVAAGVLVVDEDPVWQKPVNLEEEEDNDSPDEKPQVDEDIEVKRMKRLELLRARRSYDQISEDGSGWVSVSDAPKHSSSLDPSSDMSPPRKARYDTPSPENGKEPLDRKFADLSPPRRQTDSASPGPVAFSTEGSDLSPPRQRRRRVPHSPSRRETRSFNASKENDLSPPRKCGRRYDSPSPEASTKSSHVGRDRDLSPPRREGHSHRDPSHIIERHYSVSSAKDTDMQDLSPPRRVRPLSPKFNISRGFQDLSPPRKSQKGFDEKGSGLNSSREMSRDADLSPPRKSREERKSGLISGKDVSEEIAKIKKDELLRFNEMDPSTSGRGAEPVYRFKGERISKDEFLKLNKKEKKPKEDKKLEWGKGLAQKREAEARLQELEIEKDKPFARSRDDPELDSMMKNRLRWGDPMAHLVKKKQSDLVLPNLGESEKMKESGFIVPQEIPSHSWLKRGLDYEPNRYGIKPGRHWDGVNRSNGYEKQLFKKTNEKKAMDQEAYLWSVSDM